MLWACILLPQLALDAVLRRLEEPHAPLVLVEGPAQLRSLHSVNAAASAAGLKAGMRLSAAHALMANVRTIDYDAQSEARTQRFLAAWAYRHSSLVSQQWSRAIVLEAGASFRLFGPWPRFERRLRDELQALGFQHRLALAPTPRAARVLAGLRDGMVVTQLPALHSTLDKVPVRRAALPDDVGERLQHMGVRTLAAVRALPRDGLRRRFGAGLLDHLDRLYGQVDDPLECYAPPDHFDQRVELGYEVEMHPALLFPLRRLIGDLCTYLSIRDGGVQRFLLRLEHEQGATDVEIGLLTPERAPTLLFELARNRLERVEIPRPVVAMRLLARQLPPFVPAMRDLFDQRAQQSVEWPQLRERLRARLGDEAVYRVLPADDPRPERAWRRAIGDTVRETDAPPRPPRPTWLLPQPVPLHDAQLRIVSGPERLESGWWDDDEARRDYYVVETARGRRAWVFAAPGRVEGWMLHGWFA
ncbi:DNA polymerase Y family protein [Xanthomonas sp. WHRI 8391]|uniref:Y-family DNA polymerase n=1 Tax=Xanthomonas TaxID=338 RepID=UPI001A20057B|nr:DNA polymerase Y family protein [Xanthomonas hortorum]MBG3852035.1 DNA polymerase Y family protein [Xanthomonas hortorum pv. carotae]UTS71348.1 DNA polymerase Y family protein [Xanthomonas hortorum]